CRSLGRVLRHDLGDPHRVVLVDDDDVTTGDESAVDHDVGGAAGGAVELEDGPGGEGQDVAQRHAGAADLGGERELDVVQDAHAAGRERGGGHRRDGGDGADPEPGLDAAAAGEGEELDVATGERVPGGALLGGAEHTGA